MSPRFLPDTQVVEAALPAHMLALLVARLKATGWELRPDVEHYVNVASALPLKSLDLFSVKRCAQKIDDTAMALLHELAPEDPRKGILSVCFWVMRLVDEGLLKDATNQAVLVSLLIVEEARERGQDWSYHQGELEAKAGTIMRKSQLLGYFADVGKMPVTLQ